MEPKEITLLTVIVLGIAWNLYSMWLSKKNIPTPKPRHVFVVEDSDDDYKLFNMFVHLENCVIHRYKSADNMLFDIARVKPDLVIVDYFLAGKVRGDKLSKFCGKKIPSILVTGYEGEIVDAPPERTLIKSPEREYFDKLQALAYKLMA